MKKKFFIAAAVGILATAASFGVARASVETKAGGKYDDVPELNDNSADSYFKPIWTDQCGSRRISERGVLVNDLSDWGYRNQVDGRKFDLTSFNISLDLERIGNEQAMMLIFGSSPGAYDGTDSKLLVMDIVKGRTISTKFIVTCSVGTNPHNISIPSFTDGKVWEDDSNYQGVQVDAEDFTLNISYKKINETLTSITVNDVVTNVNNSELFAPFVDNTLGYFSIGLYNGGGAAYPYIVNSMGDATDDVYFSAEGTFGKCKSEIAYFKGLNLSGADVNTILAAKQRYDAVPYFDLYSWDQAYLYSEWEAVTSKINQAVEDAGVEMSLLLFETNVKELDKKILSLDTYEDIDEALALSAICLEEKASLESEQLDPEQTGRFDTACTIMIGCVKDVEKAAKNALEDAVKDYEDAFAEGIASGEDVVALNKQEASIPLRYGSLFEENEYLALVDRIETVNNALLIATTIVHDNWEQGITGNVVEKEDKSIDLVTCGQCMGKTNAESSGIFCTEEISVIDFDLTVNFKYLPESMGGWISFGIMEKPEMWINAENDSVQDNKGVFFLITRVNSQTLGVQCFMCSMTSNRFYDSVLVQTIQIPQNQEITIKFREVEKEIAGVKDTYFNMDFGGTSFDQTNITARKLKTVLLSKTGYFIMSSSGYGSNDPAIVNIKSINGYNPLNETIAKKVVEDKKPTTTSTEATFVKGSESGKPSFNLDTKGLEISSVTVDGAAVAASNYTYSDNKFVLTNAYANTLAVGDHKIVVTTSGGSVEWTLHVVGNSDPEPTPSKGGCGGSVIASSAILSLLAVAGLSLVLRKKEQ